MSRPKTNDPKNRKKILAAAEKAFAKKGFDATRVEYIASQARVNKALIYYYFKNKDAILMEIIDGFIAQCMDYSITESGSLEGGFSENNIVHALLHKSLSFLEQNHDILRIMIMESLKKSKRIPHLIRAIKLTKKSGGAASPNEIIGSLRSRGINIESNIQKALVNEFFTKAVPSMFFVLFHQAWAAHFSISESELKEFFIEAIEATHIAYHRTISSSNNRENQDV